MLFYFHYVKINALRWQGDIIGNYKSVSRLNFLFNNM